MARRIEDINDFYLNKFNSPPSETGQDIGHFNVFRMDEFAGKNARPAPFSPKDFYKISLIIGRNRYEYADKSIEIKDYALVFSNPMIPYHIHYLDENQKGYFCIFTYSFLSSLIDIKSYPVFRPDSDPILFPSEAQLKKLVIIYERLMEEMASEYVFKYDLIRVLLLDLVHHAIKIRPADTILPHSEANAHNRIACLFNELMNRQFPVDTSGESIQLRSPADYARQLSIHVNSLNRALKDTFGKTTSVIIAERMLQEACILLKKTESNVSEIGYLLGFEDVSHFVSFFKKHIGITPKVYRQTRV